ncbi:unnamed protein product [Linum tenue]|uniref:F-box domain-containing protein n=1 Tax=Linum tenue TaxID=586396 RepID=A0AAV0PP85_9ROSI|nr:unnamed protein product [Linum tenue]
MASGTPISKLGDDLLEEVLIRSFPNPRSACRSKPVCKRWNTLISNARFNRRFVSHHHHHDRNGAESPPPRIILLSKDDPLPSLLSCFLPVPDGLRSHFIIWDSFEDLLLCGFQKTRGELGQVVLDLQSVHEAMGRPSFSARSFRTQEAVRNKGGEIGLRRSSQQFRSRRWPGVCVLRFSSIPRPLRICNEGRVLFRNPVRAARVLFRVSRMVEDKGCASST